MPPRMHTYDSTSVQQEQLPLVVSDPEVLGQTPLDSSLGCSC